MAKHTVAKTTVETEQENGKTVVSIETPDADIYVNGVCVWSRFDKPEYEHVPPILREFILNKNDYLEIKGNQVVTDLWLPNAYTCATIYIPLNKSKEITVRMDFVESIAIIESEVIRNNPNINEETATTIISELQKDFNDIEALVKSAGYTLSPSHSSGMNYHAWWDIDFNLKNWNEILFIEIWEKLDKLNEKINGFMDN